MVEVAETFSSGTSEGALESIIESRASVSEGIFEGRLAHFCSSEKYTFLKMSIIGESKRTYTYDPFDKNGLLKKD